MDRYSNFTNYLVSRTEASFVVSLAELRRIVDLPPSAMKHPAWWANSRNSHAHAASWLDPGYIAKADFNAGTVRFERGRDRGRP